MFNKIMQLIVDFISSSLVGRFVFKLIGLILGFGIFLSFTLLPNVIVADSSNDLTKNNAKVDIAYFREKMCFKKISLSNATLTKVNKNFDIDMKNCISEFKTTPEIEINICANNAGIFDFKTLDNCISNNDKVLFEKAKGVFDISNLATVNYKSYANFSVDYIEKFDDFFIMLIGLGLVSLLFRYSTKGQFSLLSEKLEKTETELAENKSKLGEHDHKIADLTAQKNAYIDEIKKLESRLDSN